MITCHLTKLETVLDQVRKAYPKLKPSDAALVASGLSLAGRHARAIYDEQQFTWPGDYEKLCKAMVGQLDMIQQGLDAGTKKTTKATAEEEPVLVNVGLAPNVTAGESVLQDRSDLKALLGEVLAEGVEFVYAPSDIGWQWALDRANWSTVAGHEISRRVKVKVGFTEGAVGVELGAGGPKKRASKKAAEPVEEAQ